MDPSSSFHLSLVRFVPLPRSFCSCPSFVLFLFLIRSAPLSHSHLVAQLELRHDVGDEAAAGGDLLFAGAAEEKLGGRHPDLFEDARGEGEEARVKGSG
jgi:hypothetical protein